MFVDLWTGDLQESAELAGIGYGYAKEMMGSVKYSHIKELIRTRERTRTNRKIKNREERQEFWSNVMQDPQEKTPDRLKASELLGKSEADFIDRTRHEDQDGNPIQFTINIGIKQELNS